MSDTPEQKLASEPEETPAEVTRMVAMLRGLPVGRAMEIAGEFDQLRTEREAAETRARAAEEAYTQLRLQVADGLNALKHGYGPDDDPVVQDLRLEIDNMARHLNLNLTTHD